MTILFYFAVLAGVLIFAVVTLATRKRRRLSGKTVFLVVGGMIAIVRLSALFFLTYLELTHQQTLSALPLLFLLYPEVLLLSSSQPLTVGNVTLLGAALTTGSFLIGGLAGSLVAIQNKYLPQSEDDRNAQDSR
jgi:hypothetical protein